MCICKNFLWNLERFDQKIDNHSENWCKIASNWTDKNRRSLDYCQGGSWDVQKSRQQFWGHSFLTFLCELKLRPLCIDHLWFLPLFFDLQTTLRPISEGFQGQEKSVSDTKENMAILRRKSTGSFDDVVNSSSKSRLKHTISTASNT